MSGDTSVCLFEESGPVVRFAPERRTIISSVQLMLSGSTAPTKKTEVFALWTQFTPCDDLVASDGAYLDAPAVVLAAIPIDVPDSPTRCVALSVPISRLELMAGGSLALTLVHASTPSCAVLQRLAETAVRHRKRGRDRHDFHAASGSSPDRLPSDSASALLPAFSSVTFRLSGLSVGPPLSLMLSTCDWRPLLVRRWLECVVKKSTVVQPPPEKTDEMGMTRPTDQPREWWRPTEGSVMEAVAVSIDGKLVRWSSGALGLASEFVPFVRTYTPSRCDKTVRVRRHPHRHADVVGVVPFGATVEAIGRQTDPFHNEVYALLCLSDSLGECERLATDYGLASAGEGLFVWGWSKIAGVSGLPLLDEVCGVETTADARNTSPRRPTRRTRARPLPVNTTALPSCSLFTCADGKKGVPICDAPSLRATEIGTMDSNEVKEAVALVTVPTPVRHSQQSNARESPMTLSPCCEGDERQHGVSRTETLQFVQWADGGYSLLSDEHDISLAPVDVSSFSPTIEPRDTDVPHKSPGMASLALPTSTEQNADGSTREECEE